MRKWLYDNPWIWVALFLACLVAGSMATLIIAEMNRPEIVKEKKTALMTNDAPPAGVRVA
jgi:hypothetical protein